jgi:hypothetical protein
MLRNFDKNEEFCPHCLTHNYWYIGGGSWSPERCPNHSKSDDYILWKQMNFWQKYKASQLFNEMWRKTYGKEHK